MTEIHLVALGDNQVVLDLDKLTEKMKEVKQSVFDQAVTGNGDEPHDVVDTVLYALQDVLEQRPGGLLQEAIDFYPEY